MRFDTNVKSGQGQHYQFDRMIERQTGINNFYRYRPFGIAQKGIGTVFVYWDRTTVNAW